MSRALPRRGGERRTGYGSVGRWVVAGFGVMAAIVLALGLFSIYEMRSMARSQRALYEHPLAVSNAALTANAGIVKIHRAMKDVVLFDKSHLAFANAAVVAHERAVYRELDIVADRILGERGALMQVDARRLVVAWKPIRAEVVNLVRSDRRSEAAAVTAGKGAAHVQKIQLALEEIATYARRNAVAINVAAQQHHARILRGVVVALLLSIVFAAGIAVAFSRLIVAAETRSRVEHELLAAVMHGTDELICAKDDQSRTIFANAAYERVVAGRRRSSIGGSHSELFPPTVAKLLSAADGRVIKTGQSETVEFELTVRDEARTFLTRESRLVDATGTPMGVVGISQDITARKLADEQLRRSNRALAVLGGASHALTLAVDEDDLLHDICRIAVEQGGYRLAWIGYVEHDEAKTLRPVACMGCDLGYLQSLNATWSAAHADKDPAGAAARTGEPAVVRYLQGAGDGSALRDAAVEHGYQSVIGLPLAIDGEVMGVLNVCSTEPDAFDQDEARLLEELATILPYGIASLRARDDHRIISGRLQLLSMAVQQADESIVITDAKGSIQYVNPAFERASGYSYEEALGNNPRMLKSGVQSALFYKKLWAVLARGESWTGRLSNKNKQGGIYIEDATISPIVDDGGTVTHFLAVKKDITNQIAMETRTLQSQKLESIGQLSAGIAHEINTPIQFVSNNTTFLKRAFKGLTGAVTTLTEILDQAKAGAVDPDTIARAERALRKAKLDYVLREVPPAIEQSLDGIERVSKLVGAMKEFSHPSKGEMRDVDLAAAIETTIAVAKNEWKYVADVIRDFDADMPLVPCLRDEFNQVILNLVVNAAHAIADVTNNGEHGKGTITIQTRCDDDYAVIRVADTGSGIAEDDLSRIFDPFFTTKEVGKGTGQGLAIARSVVVDKHGGVLDAESEVGVGTTFTARLPLRRPDTMIERVAS